MYSKLYLSYFDNFIRHAESEVNSQQQHWIIGRIRSSQDWTWHSHDAPDPPVLEQAPAPEAQDPAAAGAAPPQHNAQGEAESAGQEAVAAQLASRGSGGHSRGRRGRVQPLEKRVRMKLEGGGEGENY